MSDVEEVYEESAPIVLGVAYSVGREPGEVSASSSDGEDEGGSARSVFAEEARNPDEVSASSTEVEDEGMDMDREELSQQQDQNQEDPQSLQGEGPSFVSMSDYFMEEVDDDPNNGQYVEDASAANIEGEGQGGVEEESLNGRFIHVNQLTIHDFPALQETRKLKKEFEGAVATGDMALMMHRDRLTNLESVVEDHSDRFERGLAQEKLLRAGKCKQFKGVVGQLTEKIAQLENVVESQTAEVESLKGQLEMEREEKMKGDKVVLEKFSEQHKVIEQLLQRDAIPVQGDQNGTVTPNPQQIMLALEPPPPPGSVDDQNKENEDENQMEEEVDQVADSSGHEGNVNVDEQEQAGESDAEAQVNNAEAQVNNAEAQVNNAEAQVNNAEAQVNNVEAESELMETENAEDEGDPAPTGAIPDIPTPTLAPPKSGLTDSKSSRSDARPVVGESALILGAPQSNANDEGVSTSATGTVLDSLGMIAPVKIKEEPIEWEVGNTSPAHAPRTIKNTVKTRARVSKKQASGPSSSKTSSLPKRRVVKRTALPRGKRQGKARAKPLVCTLCQKSFRQMPHLHDHLRTIHRVQARKATEMVEIQRMEKLNKGQGGGGGSKEPVINESAGFPGQPQPPSNDGGTGNESQCGAGGGRKETVE